MNKLSRIKWLHKMCGTKEPFSLSHIAVFRTCSSGVEQGVDNAQVGGAIPSASTNTVEDKMSLNRLANIKNPYQGNTKKVLCVCSAGLLRSPTAALVLSWDPFNYNTRAAGLSKEYALIYADNVLCEWADEIVAMSSGQFLDLGEYKNKTINLEISDNYPYRDQELMELIRVNYTAERDKRGWK